MVRPSAFPWTWILERLRQVCSCMGLFSHILMVSWPVWLAPWAVPCRHQAIIWTYAGILLITPLGTKFSEILIKIHTFSFRKMHLIMLSGKWRPFCLCLNVLRPRHAHEPCLWWSDKDFCMSCRIFVCECAIVSKRFPIFQILFQCDVFCYSIFSLTWIMHDEWVSENNLGLFPHSRTYAMDIDVIQCSVNWKLEYNLRYPYISEMCSTYNYYEKASPESSHEKIGIHVTMPWALIFSYVKFINQFASLLTWLSWYHLNCHIHRIPDSKVHGANMGPTWGRQDPGGPHVGPMNLAIWDSVLEIYIVHQVLSIISIKSHFDISCLKIVSLNPLRLGAHFTKDLWAYNSRL